jgi:hypothetical protein
VGKALFVRRRWVAYNVTPTVIALKDSVVIKLPLNASRALASCPAKPVTTTALVLRVWHVEVSAAIRRATVV